MKLLEEIKVSVYENVYSKKPKVRGHRTICVNYGGRKNML